jgi:hypothetical protein
MAWDVAQGQLISDPADDSARVVVATPDHDAAMRQLLRENPTRGRISLSFEREPAYFRSVGIAGNTDSSILALNGKRVVCMGSCAIRFRHLSGGRRRVGYLSELRLDHSVEGRTDILRRGYAFFTNQQAADPADLYFTSVASDNLRARQLLERGLRGFPRYSHLCDFVTLIFTMPSRGRHLHGHPVAHCEPATAADLPEVAQFLNAQGAERELTSIWSEERLAGLQSHGLAVEDIQVYRNKGKIEACAALWDQRAFRQTVVRGYSRSLRLARPLINLGAHVLGRAQLPPVGSVVRLAYLSPFAISQDSEGLTGSFVESLFQVARQRGIEHVALGFDASDPRIAILSRGNHPLRYDSRLYQVNLRGNASGTPAPGRRIFEPELAFL